MGEHSDYLQERGTKPSKPLGQPQLHHRVNPTISIMPLRIPKELHTTALEGGGVWLCYVKKLRHLSEETLKGSPGWQMCIPDDQDQAFLSLFTSAKTNSGNKIQMKVNSGLKLPEDLGQYCPHLVPLALLKAVQLRYAHKHRYIIYTHTKHTDTQTHTLIHVYPNTHTYASAGHRFFVSVAMCAVLQRSQEGVRAHGTGVRDDG